MTNQKCIQQLEDSVINFLESAIKLYGKGYGYRKNYISEKTNIPVDILTVILKRLKYKGKVTLIMIWDEGTGLPDGSGYRISYNIEVD